MAPHSSTLAWKIPGMEESGRLQSMGSQRVGHDWATSLSLFTFMHWRRIWQPTPVFLHGESQGPGSLVGCCLWGCTESDTTEVTQQQQHKLVTTLGPLHCRWWGCGMLGLEQGLGRGRLQEWPGASVSGVEGPPKFVWWCNPQLVFLVAQPCPSISGP